MSDFKPSRHPGESRDRYPLDVRPGQRSRIGSGTTMLLAAAALLALTACEVKDASKAEGPPQGGPPPMPQPVTLADRPEATGGEKLFVEHCIMCHGAVGMGTGLLARRVQVPQLEDREDLQADYVIQAVRMGIGNMPAIPRGEITDGELDQIAQYLAAGPHAPDQASQGEAK
jgi:mono/diheme cytochrome c family protein